MRVIAGKARRIILKSLEGEATRPTLDRYKETLFNTMQAYIPDSYFIDVFAGTGSIGIEALSRGAAKAVFIENSKKALAVINENLEKTRLAENAEVIASDAVSALIRLEHTGPADVIFIDPPYNRGYEIQVLKLLSSSKLAGDDTLVVVEASNETGLDEIGATGFNILKTKDYRTNRHIFLLKRTD
ncbi:MAG: 16S rRNA (guanine(966)-N(2))-methyltransferase RsmD [Lachnospiraceae bacterium]|nr:16S rRNA (guanine(966)-N(2))-methyltransferase RsmD [Lachnospiraceae bacterium]